VYRTSHRFPTRRSSDLTVTMMVPNAKLKPILRCGLLISPATADEECQESLLNNAPTKPAEIAPKPAKKVYSFLPPSTAKRLRFRSEEHTSELQSRENLV